MAFDLTQRSFEGPMDEKAKCLSEEAIKTQQNHSLECGTRNGWLSMIFTPQRHVEITWRNRNGLEDDRFIKDWTIKTTIQKIPELLNF